LSEDEQAGPRPHDRLPAQAAVVLILLFAISTASAIGRKGPATVAGDQALKQELLQRYQQPPPEHRKNWLERAFTEYEEAARDDPTPAVIRRLGIVAAEVGRQGMPIFQRLASRDVLEGAHVARKRELRREVQMWRDIYQSARVDARGARKYEKMIGELGLGPAKWLALKRMYMAAGRPRQAAEMERRGEERAFHSLAAATGVMIFWVLIGIAGGVFALPALIARRRELVARLSDPPRGRVPSPQTLWSSLIAFLLLFALFQLVGGAAAAKADADYGIIAAFSSYVLAGILGMAWLVRRVREEGADLSAIGLVRGSVLRGVLTGAAAYGAMLPFIGAAVLIVLAGEKILPGLRSPVHPVAPLLGEAADRPIVLLLLVLVAVMAPFFEETFFRGVLFSALRSRFGAAGSILLSSAAFAAIHPQLPLGFLPIFVLGTGFAATFAVTKSLIPSMAAHSINNTLTFLVAVLTLGN